MWLLPSLSSVLDTIPQCVFASFLSLELRLKEMFPNNFTVAFSPTLTSFLYFCLHFPFGSLIKFLSMKKPRSQGIFSLSVYWSVFSSLPSLVQWPGLDVTCASVLNSSGIGGMRNHFELVVLLCRYSHVPHLLEARPGMKQTPLCHSDFWATCDATVTNELHTSCACKKDAIN